MTRPRAFPPLILGLLLAVAVPSFGDEPATPLFSSNDLTAPAEVLSRKAPARTNQQGADFRPPATAQAWRDRAAAVREQMLVALGLSPMPPKTDLHPRVVGTLERDGYAIDRVVLETFPGFTLAGNLYRPHGAKGRLPGILCPHGHSAEGRVNVDVQSRCVRLAQLGCVVFLYDMVGYADGKPFGHAFLDDRLRRWGLSLPGLQTWDSLRALDWFLSRPDVDPARVAITGESGGATQTLLLCAIDDRIKVSVPVVMVSDTFQGGCVCENAAGLRLGTDNVEIAALMAPRPMKLIGASGDWTARTMTNAYPAIQAVYGLVGTPNHLEAEVFDFPHNYNRTSRDAAYAFLAKWLLDPMEPGLTREGTLKLEDPKDLFAFDSAHPYPADAKTPAQLEDTLIRSASAQLDQLAPGDSAPRWEAARGLLKSTWKVRLGLVDPAARETTAKEVRRVARDGLTIVHTAIGRQGFGEAIPVVRLIPASPDGRVAILASGRGKAGLATAEGSPSPVALALLARGFTVVGFDPSHVGEARESVPPPAPARPANPFPDCYNPSLAAARAQELATVVSWARSLAGAREVDLVALGEAGPLALLARPGLEGISRTVVDLEGFDYGDGSGPVPPGLDLPGVLQFGGLKAAAALSSPAPLWIVGASEGFDASWPTKAYGLADDSPRFRFDRKPVDPEAVARWLDLGE